MRLHRRVGCVLLAAFLVACATTQGAREHATNELWVFEFDERLWALGYSQAAGDRAIREYVLAGESVENWTELVTTLYAGVSVEPHALYEHFRNDIARDCASLEISVVEETATSVLFEWRHQGCQGIAAQHELHRVVNTGTSTYSLAFVEKTQKLTAEKRGTWLSILRAASIRPGG